MRKPCRKLPSRPAPNTIAPIMRKISRPFTLKSTSWKRPRRRSKNSRIIASSLPGSFRLVWVCCCSKFCCDIPCSEGYLDLDNEIRPPTSALAAGGFSAADARLFLVELAQAAAVDYAIHSISALACSDGRHFPCPTEASPGIAGSGGDLHHSGP